MNPFFLLFVGIFFAILEIFHPYMFFLPVGISLITLSILIFLGLKSKLLIYFLFLFLSIAYLYIFRKLFKKWEIKKKSFESYPEEEIKNKRVIALSFAKAGDIIKVRAKEPILGLTELNAKVLDDVNEGDELITVSNEGGLLVCKKINNF